MKFHIMTFFIVGLNRKSLNWKGQPDFIFHMLKQFFESMNKKLIHNGIHSIDNYGVKFKKSP